MKLPIYAAATSLVVSLFVVAGIFAVRPGKSLAQRSVLRPTIVLHSESGSPLSAKSLQLHQSLLAGARDDDMVQVRECLEAGANPNVFDDDSWTFTPLTYAAQNNDIPMMRLLLAHGADANAGGIRMSALYWTISGNSSAEVVDCLRLLLQEGADPLSTDPDGDLPIVLAAYEGNVPVVKLLIEWMPKLDAYDRRKYLQKAKNVALCKASEEGTLSQIRQLIVDGADVNYANEANEPPLMGAVSRGSVPIVNYLLDHGAKIDLLNTQERTALMSTGNPDGTIDKNLAQAGGEIAEILLRHGAKLEAHDTFKMTALMYAAQGNPRAVSVLLARGAKVNELDDSGNNSLYYAAKARDVQSMEMLLHNGVCVDIQNNVGETALMIASVMPDSWGTAKQRTDRFECLKLLRRFGANEKLKDKWGRTAKSYMSLQDADFVSAG